MQTASYYETAAYTPNEASSLLVPKDYIDPSSQRSIIALHGHGGGPNQWMPGWIAGDHVQHLADRGYAVFSINAGGGTTWNNNTAMTAISAAYDYLVARGMSSSKVGLIGWSMGGGNALQWLKQNTTKVSAVLLWAPATDLDYFHNDATYTSEIDTAYGGNYAANSVGHKIADEYSTWRNLCPIKLIHGTSDATIPASQSSNFVNGVNQSQVTYFPVSGQGHSNLFDDVPLTDTFDFFEAGSW